MKKRLMAFLMAAIMLIGVLPVAALAAEQGTCDHWFAWKHDVASNKCYKECTTCGLQKEVGDIWYAWVDDGNGNHYKHCTHCNNGAFDKEHGEHWFAWKHDVENNKCYKECTTCGLQKEVGDIWYAWVDDGNGNHYKHCIHCNNGAFDKQHGEHWFAYKNDPATNEHWKECTTCGLQKERAEHDFDGFWNIDENDHWEACEVCGMQKDRAAHDYGEAIVIPYEGTGFGRKVEICNTCGWQHLIEDNVVIPEVDHRDTETTEECDHWYAWVHDVDTNKCYKKCTQCGDTKEEGDIWFAWFEDENGNHYKHCIHCNNSVFDKERGEHWFAWKHDVANNRCYKECTTCGKQKEVGEIWFAWFENEAGEHYKHCIHCNNGAFDKEVGAHTFGEDGTCTVCGHQQ